MVPHPLSNKVFKQETESHSDFFLQIPVGKTGWETLGTDQVFFLAGGRGGVTFLTLAMSIRHEEAL